MINNIFIRGWFSFHKVVANYFYRVCTCHVSGYMVIWNVTASLHTPLMSVTIAVSSIIIIGAITQISTNDTAFSSIRGCHIYQV